MITKATLADIPSLNILINSAYRGESSKKGWTTEANLLEGKRTTEEELTQTIQDPKNTILKFTVSPELQNSGIGRKMLAEAENHAKSLGLTSIIMSVISVREELIAWYKRNGYVDTGEREVFPSSDIHINISEKPLEFIYFEKQL